MCKGLISGARGSVDICVDLKVLGVGPLKRITSPPLCPPFPYFMNILSDMRCHHYFLLTQAEVKPVGLSLGYCEPSNKLL